MGRVTKINLTKRRERPDHIMTHNFNVGDIVRLKSGWTPLVVQTVIRGDFHCRYAGSHSMESKGIYRRSQIKLIDSLDEIKKCRDWKTRLTSEQYDQLMSQVERPDSETCENKGTDTMKLYQTKDEPPRYGTKLTVNSTGKIVLEMKGTGGAVETFDAADLELVVPYTVKVQNLRGDKEFHARAVKGQVNVGDIIVQPYSSGQFAAVLLVVMLDTQQTDVNIELRGSKILTEPLGE